MDTEVRNPQYWALDFDEAVLEGGLAIAEVFDDYPPGNGQISVEPGVPQAAAIALHVQLDQSACRSF